MELKFFSIDEVKEFVKQLKGTRGGKGGDADETATGAQTAPPPLMPPPNPGPGFNTGAFAPLAPAAAPGAAFPAPAAAPEVLAIVQRITVRLDGAIASGQPADQALGWLRSQIGPEAANYTLDQCKQALVRCSMPTLENIAKLMNA